MTSVQSSLMNGPVEGFLGRGGIECFRLLITFLGGREPRLDANRAICAVPRSPFARINSEFTFEITVARLRP